MTATKTIDLSVYARRGAVSFLGAWNRSCGLSGLCCAIAASWSQKGTALFLAFDRSELVKETIAAAGGNLANVRLVRPTPGNTVAILSAAVAKVKPALIVIDPLDSHLAEHWGEVEPWRALVQMARKHNVAVLACDVLGMGNLGGSILLRGDEADALHEMNVMDGLEDIEVHADGLPTLLYRRAGFPVEVVGQRDEPPRKTRKPSQRRAGK
jgi:hypothetical protein